jgi:hypothetical protein
MAFQLAFERRHRVIKAKAAGVLATQDLFDLDMALVAFLAREMIMDTTSLRCLYDFSEITAVAVPQTKAEERGSLPAIVRGHRVMVLSRTLACSLVDSFVQGQRRAGHHQLTIVGSLEEAHALLGFNAPQFEAIE